MSSIVLPRVSTQRQRCRFIIGDVKHNLRKHSAHVQFKPTAHGPTAHHHNQRPKTSSPPYWGFTNSLPRGRYFGIHRLVPVRGKCGRLARCQRNLLASPRRSIAPLLRLHARVTILKQSEARAAATLVTPWRVDAHLAAPAVVPRAVVDVCNDTNAQSPYCHATCT